MLSKASVKILRSIFDALPDSLHLREVARRADISSETAHRLLHKLNREGVLVMEEKGREKIFSLNLKNPFLPKYFELIKGKDASDLISAKAEIGAINDYLMEKISAKTDKNYSILLLSMNPIKIVIIVPNQDYEKLDDDVRTFQKNFEGKYPHTSLVLMSEHGLRNNLEKYPHMRDVIKMTVPLHGSEYYFNILFSHWA